MQMNLTYTCPVVKRGRLQETGNGCLAILDDVHVAKKAVLLFSGSRFTPFTAFTKKQFADFLLKILQFPCLVVEPQRLTTRHHTKFVQCLVVHSRTQR